MIPAVQLADGTAVPALGQGTWKMGEAGKMGEGGRSRRAEADALRLGIELGMTLIDTAEMYADGAAEEVVADAIAGQRDRVFVVTKVYPHNASARAMPAACARSLKRLGTDRIDLYLLHWSGSVPLAETVAAFEKLRAAGAIRRWGVSNFDLDDMAALAAVSDGCAANQVLYNPASRGIEFDLLAWCAARGIAMMGYSPVGQGGALLRSAALRQVGLRHGVTPAQVALAWGLRQPGMIVIPKASDPAHVRANAAAAGLRLTEADLAEIDAMHVPPRRRQSLEIL